MSTFFNKGDSDLGLAEHSKEFCYLAKQARNGQQQEAPPWWPMTISRNHGQGATR